MRHFIFIRSGDFGDNVSLTPTGILQMEAIADYSTEKIIAKEKISSYEMLISQGSKVALECRDIFQKDISLRAHISEHEFLKISNREKDEVIVRRLLHMTKSSQLVLIISQFANLKNLPKTMLKLSPNPSSHFFKFAISSLNFQNKRGVHIAYDEEGKIHEILSV